MNLANWMSIVPAGQNWENLFEKSKIFNKKVVPTDEEKINQEIGLPGGRR